MERKNYLSNCSSKWVQKPRYTSLGEAVGKHINQPVNNLVPRSSYRPVFERILEEIKNWKCVFKTGGWGGLGTYIPSTSELFLETRVAGYKYFSA